MPEPAFQIVLITACCQTPPRLVTRDGYSWTECATCGKGGEFAPAPVKAMYRLGDNFIFNVRTAEEMDLQTQVHDLDRQVARLIGQVLDLQEDVQRLNRVNR